MYIALYKKLCSNWQLLNWTFYYSCVSSEHLRIRICCVEYLLIRSVSPQSLLDGIWNLLYDVCFRKFGICFKPIIWLFARTISSILQIKWNFHILLGDLLVFLIDCLIFLSPSLDVTRMPTSTVSFLAQLDSGIFCQ